MITIGIDASRAYANERTGTETYAAEIIEGLLKVSRDSRFLLYRKRAAGDPPRFSQGNTEDRQLGWPPKYFWHLGRLSFELRKQEPDVFFEPAHTLPILHPIPSVATIHDIGFEDSPELYSRPELLYHRWAFAHTLKSATAIITVSQFTKDRIVERYPWAERKTKVIHHGFRPLPPPEAISSAVVERCLKHHHIHSPYLLSVGRLQTKKNTHQLIRAWSRLRSLGFPHHLVLAGIPGTGYQEVVAAKRESPYAADLHELGYVSQLDKACLYVGASVFAFPSLYEGFGFPVLEAMAYRTPVVVARTASLPEVAGDAALYCNPLDLDDMVHTLRRCLEEASIREELTLRGLRRFREFSWDACAQKTLSLLQSVARR